MPDEMKPEASLAEVATAVPYFSDRPQRPVSATKKAAVPPAGVRACCTRHAPPWPAGVGNDPFWSAREACVRLNPAAPGASKGLCAPDAQRQRPAIRSRSPSKRHSPGPSTAAVLWLSAALLWAGNACALSRADAVEAARTWLVRDLDRQMSADGGPSDMNRVASLVFTLARNLGRSADGPTGAALVRVRDYLAAQEPAAVDCDTLSDYYMTGTFLREAGYAFELGALPERFAHCLEHASDLALFNALILVGRYDLPTSEGYLEAAVPRVEAAQQSNGSFTEKDGPNDFYHTSHAVLGLHYAGGDPEVIRRGHAYLLRHLPDMVRIGFLDGLAETLIFLHWMGVEVPGEPRYLRHLLDRVRPDGGLCFRDQPGCESDWHATSLLYELLHTY